MKYSGKVKMEYKEWSSKTINYLSSNYEYVKSILETAAKSQEGITGKWMESLEKTNKDYVDVHKWDHKIFVQLGSMTTSTAWLTVDRSKGGLEAWRQLARNNDPKTMQTSMDYTELLSGGRKAGGFEELRGKIEEMEELSSQFNAASDSKLSEGEQKHYLKRLPDRLE